MLSKFIAGSLDQIYFFDRFVDFFLFGWKNFWDGDLDWENMVSFLSGWPSKEKAFIW